jgi:hypothetical protein
MLKFIQLLTDIHLWWVRFSQRWKPLPVDPEPDVPVTFKPPAGWCAYWQGTAAQGLGKQNAEPIVRPRHEHILPEHPTVQ